MSTELNVPTTIIGKDTDEVLFGNVLNNSIYAYGGNDVVYADSGNDFVNGGTGNNVRLCCMIRKTVRST
jgi:Ca2+-binding RTX toxin-like protein